MIPSLIIKVDTRDASAYEKSPLMLMLKVEEVAEQQLLVKEGERKAAVEVLTNEQLIIILKSTLLSLLSKSH